ncbi:hamartin isoform X1 [Anthonomus grandis grandis]|uniref:hamartin isoform X1 n=1 Tax=Anthonomus grandis grandis TaxID=2921223 RepID=UPI0021660856|nr:hamartin isoform X1 [Anthonomus grandis grandis]
MTTQADKIIDMLESGDKEVVKEAKKTIWDLFSRVQDPWLINGLYDYYLSTNSVRCMEVLITLKEPHQHFLFDKLCDSVTNPKTNLKVRVQAFTLLGHIARSQPTWLQKLPDHSLFKEILKYLLKETELLPLISALLLLIVLLPMFPSSIGKHLEDIFDIFSRLAAWNSHVPGKLVEDQMIHLQVALYALFLRLYGMYPGNFLSYLRSNFKDRNNPVFCHTIKPMMDTVKMHPSLVTTSKENETTTERWKKMGVHDVIVECERFSLDITDRCPHETCQNTTEFRSRSGTMNSTVGNVPMTDASYYHQQNIRSLASLQISSHEDTFFSPSQVFPVQNESLGLTHHRHMHVKSLIGRASYPVSQEGSPPEAAIEATPETTPIRDFSATPVMPLASKTSVARALTSFRSNSSGYIVSGTPTNSVPSSPMRKEPSPFIFPVASSAVFMPIAQGSSSLSQTLAYKLTQERQYPQVSDCQTSKPPPSSPLKIMNSDSNRQRIESPVSQEDEEVTSISVSANKTDTSVKKRVSRYCDSVLPDFEDSDCKDTDDIEHGSPCAAGGLHMPNSKSINNFKKRIRRFRKDSQCSAEPDLSDTVQMSTGSSPGNGLPIGNNSTVRRAKSCPDMKKTPYILPKSKPFYETDEETVSEDQGSNHSNGVEGRSRRQKFSALMDSATQTEVFWPMPYEHLFLNVFPSLKEESLEVKPSPVPSPAPALNQVVETYKPSLYDILDKYIEKSVATGDSNTLREQLQLLHQQFLFERHRRETHAYRNRRLLSDAKSTRLLEECNSALRDQVQLEQKEIDDLRKQLEDDRKQSLTFQKELTNTVDYLQDKCKKLTDENARLKDLNKNLELDLTSYQSKCCSIDKERQEAQATLLDALAEGKIAKEQALAGEKVKQELQRVNRELLLMGELHIKYLEQLDQLPSIGQYEESCKRIADAYKEEVKTLQHLVEAKSSTLEAYRSRIFELEHSLTAKEEIIASQKRTLTAVNEEKESVLAAVNSKYRTQLTINHVLEGSMLELRQKIEAEIARRRTHSPDTSSCHEVHASLTTGAGGLSPQHSSPLSASLASSEDMQPEARHVQMYMDQEGSSRAYSDEPGHTG